MGEDGGALFGRSAGPRGTRGLRFDGGLGSAIAARRPISLEALPQWNMLSLQIASCCLAVVRDMLPSRHMHHDGGSD